MGEFSYSQDFDFSAGYDGNDPNGQAFGYEGYQQEVQSLVPDGVPMVAAILMEKGLLSMDQVNAILARQSETGDTLVQILLDDGYAAPDQLVDALQNRAAYR
jgi:hypothetical protein